ncbi:MAG: energy transducer TonB [Dysgonamonadaceae bacterium]|jgi:protein TonB|nr:energy transducer TonB [Dysgonamonadaceae bacterium]
MTKDIDLTSQKWLSLVFEGKNKDYGAYVLRDESSNRHFRALIIVTLVGLCAIFLPKLVSSVLPANQVIEQTTVVDLSDLAIEQEIPDEAKLPEIEVPPPPLLQETIQFTPPVITQDENVRDEDLMRSQQELSDNQVEISIANVEGVKEGGVNIADIATHHVVVQEEEKPKIFDHVEVPPQFPGGERELMKYLSENIHYPTIAAEQGIQGRVVLRFVVTPDGTVGNVEVLRSLDPSCDKEAVRVVKNMPKWSPGKQNGNSVYVYYNLPVSFKLQN